MTRKEEIREAARLVSGLKSPELCQAAIPVLVKLILELTAPESSPAPLENQVQEPKYSEEQLVLTVLEAFKRGIDKCMEFMKSPECLEAISKYREGLTRRTEGKGRTEGDLEK